MPDYIRIPGDHLRKLLAGKLRTYTAESGIMLLTAGMDLTNSRSGPLRNTSVRLYTAGAGALFLFRTTNAALTAGCDCSEIGHCFSSLFRHSEICCRL